MLQLRAMEGQRLTYRALSVRPCLMVGHDVELHGIGGGQRERNAQQLRDHAPCGSSIAFIIYKIEIFFHC